MRSDGLVECRGSYLEDEAGIAEAGLAARSLGFKLNYDEKVIPAVLRGPFQ